jgi:type IV pilus assembly protein PilN
MTIKVDLLDRPGRRMGFDPIIFFLVLVVVIFVIGFYIFGTTLEKKVSEKKTEIAQIDEKIRDLEEKIPKIKELEEINKELEAQINTIKQLVYDPIRYANLMDELALIMPNNVFIRNLSIDPTSTSLTFSGLSVDVEAKPLETISKFMRDLQKSKYFKDAILTTTRRTEYEKKEAFEFNIKVIYDPDTSAR